MRDLTSEIVVVLTNLQDRVVRLERAGQLHDTTRAKQTERNDLILTRMRNEVKAESTKQDPYV